MKYDNNFTSSFILEKFKDESSKNQIKNLEKQMLIFDKREKEKKLDINDPQTIKGLEQIIFSIISNNIDEKINYFTDSNNNNFDYELFIYILMELIKLKISPIYKISKNFDYYFFKELNENNINKKKSIILDFLISFNNNLNNNEIKEEDDEESFLISCIKIILILDKYIEKNKIKGIFGQIKSKENKKLINKLSIYLINVLNIFIRIKRNKEKFKGNNDEIIDKKIQKDNYNYYIDLIEKEYKKNMQSLILLLFDIIFKYDLITFFKIIINNDDISKIIINKLGYDQQIRYLLLELLNNSPIYLGEIEQKELLKILSINDTIIILFNYIKNDINNNKYNSSENLLKLSKELKILYFFSVLINSKDNEPEKIIINILAKMISKINKDKAKKIFEILINDLFKLRKKIPKHRKKLYSLIFLIGESFPNFRKNVLKIFFTNMKGHYNEYLEIKENFNPFNLFINNLYKYEKEIISIFFDFFLWTLIILILIKMKMI